MSKIGQTISQYWENIQGSLFPWLEKELEQLTKKQQQLITILELIRIEQFVVDTLWIGRPLSSRSALARAFVAKSVYNMETTRNLIERLATDKSLRRICGWEYESRIPSEATFSRAFEEFAKTQLPQKVHEKLVMEVCKDDIIQHVSNDSTAIEAREKPKFSKKVEQSKDSEPSEKKTKRGRPRKGEIKEPKFEELQRLDKQPIMTLPEMIADLPQECNVGCKKNSQGYIEKWTGYKLHISTADGGIPLSAILTSASLHDSQVSIPLMAMTAQRSVNLYDLFDAAYDDKRIDNYSRSLNHVPIIDINPRRNVELKKDLEKEAMARKVIHWKMPEDLRYNERTTAERTNARLKDEFGGRKTKVKGCTKVMCHLMFGILALTADQLIKMLT